MGLIIAIDFKGKEATYLGKYTHEYSKALNVTKFAISLFWDKASADANPTLELDTKEFRLNGLLTVAECYEQIKLMPEFEGAENDD